MSAKHARVEVYQGEKHYVSYDSKIGRFSRGDRAWYWRFVATNGKIVADSAEGYHRRGSCLNGAAVALGLPKWVRDIEPGRKVLVRRSGGPVRVVVEASS